MVNKKCKAVRNLLLTILAISLPLPGAGGQTQSARLAARKRIGEAKRS